MTSLDSSFSAEPATSATASTANLSLADVLQAFEQWRAAKTNPGEPIPQALWQQIFALEKSFSSAKLRTLFGISQAQYQKKYLEFYPAAKVDAPLPAASSAATPFTFCEVKPARTSVYQSSPVPIPEPPLIIEFCRPDGQIMKIYTSTDRLNALLTQFFAGADHAADHR